MSELVFTKPQSEINQNIPAIAAKPKKLFIKTIGCAMNTRDSEHMIALLKTKNYSLTSTPEEADLILINTCSVRDKPERRLFSEIGLFNKVKRRDAKIGICGCTASSLGSEIIRRAPSVDFVLGARNVSKILEMLDRPKAVEVDINYDDSNYIYPPLSYDGEQINIRSLINISIGCDKKCSYCIVPNTRGREISIPPEIILNEAKRLIEKGTKEILLLGQNVNNYGAKFSNSNTKVNFTSLLKMLSEIEDLERIRFISPHPLHMDDEFIYEFANNPKICKFIHMPLQSGSNKILRDMRRGYTKEWYLKKVDKLKSLVPNINISTDIIIGYPTETQEDFNDTLEVIKAVDFETIYSFIYSPRKGTASYELKEIDKKTSSNRLNILQNMHRNMLKEKTRREIGTVHKVLFENISDEYYEGRSDNGKIIKVSKDEVKSNMLGEIHVVRITDHIDGNNIANIMQHELIR